MRELESVLELPVKTIVLGADHAGFELKEKIAQYLKEKGISVEDSGCYSAERVDYPLMAQKAMETFLAYNRTETRAILCCGSGIGISIAANRFAGVRAVLASDVTAAKLSRLHNDANVLCMGGRMIAPELAFEIIDTWLETPFEGGRHESRVTQLDTLTDKLKSETGEPSQQCSI